jgi:hypothetical protein
MDAVAEMETVLKDVARVNVNQPVILASAGHDAKRFHSAAEAEGVFVSMWAKSEPFVVENVGDAITADQFMEIDNAADHICNVVHVYPGGNMKGQVMTWANYFSIWAGKTKVGGKYRPCSKVKVSFIINVPFFVELHSKQDYPPNDNLQDIHEVLCDRFAKSLQNLFWPYTGLKGPLNVGSCWPSGSNPPDLGNYFP